MQESEAIRMGVPAVSYAAEHLRDTMPVDRILELIRKEVTDKLPLAQSAEVTAFVNQTEVRVRVDTIDRATHIVIRL